MKQSHWVLVVSAVALLASLVSHASAARAESSTAAFDRDMQPVLASYLLIQERLARDSLDGIGVAADALKQMASRLDAARVTGEHAAHYKDVPANLRRAAEAVAQSRDIGTAREAFKQLSQPMAMWATMSHPDGVDVLFCPKAKASWLQNHGDVRNPYYGASNQRCGEALASAGHTSGRHQGAHTDEHHAH